MFEIMKNEGKIPVAITIAGSDSSGGAGIQADLKTFSALGVYGTTAITCITAQNTYSITAIECLEPEIIGEQIKQVAKDLGINAGKTGMLYTEEIIKKVANEISQYKFPLVIDPVMTAKSGAPLIKHEAEEALKKYLFPLATVVTPNRFEAERLTGKKIMNIEDMKKAAKEIYSMGPKAVLVKGGHLNIEGQSVDVLYYNNEYEIFRSRRLKVKTTHGTGCSLSAAITAFLARGENVSLAVKHAKDFITQAIKFGLNIGKGTGPVNPMAILYREASRYNVLKSVEKAQKIVESSPFIAELIPEVGMNIAMALPYAENTNDIAAIPGRLVRVFDEVKSSSCPKFGASSHLARYLLEVLKYDEKKKAAINIRFSKEILDLLKEMDFKISFYDRSVEPEEIKSVEGKTIPWGVKQAIDRINRVPDVIYHKGCVGKEPMIVLFGENPIKLAEKVAEIAIKLKRSISK